MKKIISLVLISIFSSLSFAQEEIKLSNDEFLKKLERKEITMKRDPFMPGLPEGERQKFMEQLKQKYPSFREAFWFIPNLKTNKYVYTVFYEWPTKRCLLRIEGFDRKKNEYKRDELQPVGTVVDKKYCEAAYGIKIDF